MLELKERNAEIIKLRQEGLGLQEIGERFGISRERVRQICGSPTESVREVRTRLRRQKVVELLEQKKSVRTISLELGENPAIIYSDIFKLGLKPVSIVEERFVRGVRRCYRCHENKPLDQFTPGNPETCRVCAYRVTLKWISENRERHNANQNRWHKKRYWENKEKK